MKEIIVVTAMIVIYYGLRSHKNLQSYIKSGAESGEEQPKPKPALLDLILIAILLIFLMISIILVDSP